MGGRCSCSLTARRLVKKFLMSGRGRCNFIYLHIDPALYISSNPHFVKLVLSSYTLWEFNYLVEKHGIAYHQKTLVQFFLVCPVNLARWIWLSQFGGSDWRAIDPKPWRLGVWLRACRAMRFRFARSIGNACPFNFQRSLDFSLRLAGLSTDGVMAAVGQSFR